MQKRKAKNDLNDPARNKINRTKQYIRRLEERRNTRLFERPKQVEELPCRERERLQQLFSIYADQTSKSFRKPIKNLNRLPQLPLLPRANKDKRITGTQGKEVVEGTTPLSLPSINKMKVVNNKRKSNIGTMRLPSVKNWMKQVMKYIIELISAYFSFGFYKSCTLCNLRVGNGWGWGRIPPPPP